MSPEQYPEIKAIDTFIEAQAADFHRNDQDSTQFDLLSGTLHLSNKEYPVFIDDEYGDLELADKRIPIVLALREFEIIDESKDYLHWCTMQGIPANSEIIRSYYQDTVKRIPELKKHFNSGKLTSFISDLDFQLNAGAMQWLRSRPY